MNQLRPGRDHVRAATGVGAWRITMVHWGRRRLPGGGTNLDPATMIDNLDGMLSFLVNI